jgi:hypothetical protein
MAAKRDEISFQPLRVGNDCPTANKLFRSLTDSDGPVVPSSRRRHRPRWRRIELRANAGTLFRRAIEVAEHLQAGAHPAADHAGVAVRAAALNASFRRFRFHAGAWACAKRIDVAAGCLRRSRSRCRRQHARKQQDNVSSHRLTSTHTKARRHHMAATASTAAAAWQAARAWPPGPSR